MFFISDAFAKTFSMTVQDLLYCNPNREVFVTLHPKDYHEITNRLFSMNEIGGHDHLYKILPKYKIWTSSGSSTIKFLTSEDMERGTIYLFQNHQITTVNLIQKQDGEEKNTLPGS